MSIYQLRRQQRIPAGMEEVWNFFSNPENLSVLTPPALQLRITSKDTGSKIFQGQIITYKVSPILSVPLSWMTEISYVSENKYFVDEQRLGPFTVWKHFHSFERKEDGVLMTDVVHYQLPLGILGRVAHFLFVRRQLENIFSYREQQIRHIFNDQDELLMA